VAQRVRELTDGVGVNVVFDSVGKNTFMGSLDSLKRRGLMVCVGTASGPIPPFDPVMLAMKGSLFLTRPALADYIADPAKKRPWPASCSTTSAMAASDRDQPALRLAGCRSGPPDLESRKTTGSSIFVI
jgi:NADPH:quinone reductase-like Zn-dependent oxidoreductase